MNQNHAFLRFKDEGMSRRMRGKILVELVFVTDRASMWLQDEMDEFYDVYKASVNDLCRQAAAVGVPLSFSAMVGRFLYNGSIKPEELSSVAMPKIHQQYLRSQGFSNTMSHLISRKRTNGVDEVAVVFVLEKYLRAYASMGGEREYCVLTEGNDVHTIAHELLHLFGAVDLYHPYHIHGLTMRYFPKTVMCTAEGSEVDPLTQYLVGWKTQMDPKAREFMNKLSDYTIDRNDQAITLEHHRNREDYLLQTAVPYGSLWEITQKCQTCDPWAEFLMGICCREGIGQAKNAENAEAFFARSGRTGLTIGAHAHAQMILRHGICTYRDQENLWMIANYHSYDHLEINSLRAACILHGVGTQANRSEAISQVLTLDYNEKVCREYAARSARLYRIAEKLSSRIPELHEQVKKIRAYYEDILASGDPNLQVMVAQIRERGEGVARDPYKAFQLYQKAARKGNGLACRELSRCYRDGIGTTREPRYAQQWSTQSLIRRDKDAWDAFCSMK